MISFVVSYAFCFGSLLVGLLVLVFAVWFILLVFTLMADLLLIVLLL